MPKVRGKACPLTQHHDGTGEECLLCKGLWLDRGELETLSQRENEGWSGRFIRRSITSWYCHVRQIKRRNQ